LLVRAHRCIVDALLVVAPLAIVLAIAVPGIAGHGRHAGPALDRAAAKWVEQTLNKMTLDEKIGQLLVTSLNATFTSTDSDAFEKLRHLVRDTKVGGIHVFGGAEAFPALMLNPTYAGGGASRKGDPYAAAAMLNRLQREAQIPILTTADFEGGVGYMLAGATRLPRAMAIGATRDPDLAYRAGRLSAEEGRALGVVVDFYPIVDVNNNARNPIINIRSFGEDVQAVSQMAQAYIRGVQDGGMIATAKHFPGHGDTATDTHLGLAVIEHPRSHLDQVELPPFKAAIDAGVGAVMSSHIALPALDPAMVDGAAQPLRAPATLSRPILTGLLRDEMKFDGLIYTDSMSMLAISQNVSAGRAAALAVRAGADQVLHSPDDDQAFAGIKAAVAAGEIAEAQITRSAERVLTAKARMGLHASRGVDLAAVDTKLGTREHEQVANDLAARALTLIKDERSQVPLALPKSASVLYLSVIDYASGWREGAPSRTFLPELKKRWPNVTGVEVSDRTSADEFDLVRALAKRSDAIVVSVFVRIASYSGRMDLSERQVSLLESLAAADKPYVAVLFGNPYTATVLQKLPTMVLTYEAFDAVENAAVRALAGEAPIGGKLPIALPGMFPIGHGLERPAKATAAAVGVGR
jgi:beta-N-acetylhexosaminidase